MTPDQIASRRASWLSLIAIAISLLALVPAAYRFFGFDTPADVKTEQLSVQRAFPFFATLKPGTLASLQSMATYAAPNSAAYRYARVFYEASVAYYRGTNQQPPATSVEQRKSTIAICVSKDPCQTVSDFVFDPKSSLLASYSVNGKPLATRVIPQQEWRHVDDLWFRLDGAWENSDGRLAAVLSVQNESRKAARLDTSEMYYFDYDQVQHGDLGARGTLNYPSGSSGLVYVQVPQQKLGGYFSLMFRTRQDKAGYVWAQSDVPEP